jgi:hypothetical protein
MLGICRFFLKIIFSRGGGGNFESLLLRGKWIKPYLVDP